MRLYRNIGDIIGTELDFEAYQNRLVLLDRAYSRNVMAVSVALSPGKTIRWRKRRFVVVDSTGFDAIIAREVGKSRLARIPVSEVQPDHTTDRRGGSASDLVSVDEKQWRAAVKRFSILKPLFEMDKEQRTRVHVEKVAKILKRHPATI